MPAHRQFFANLDEICSAAPFVTDRPKGSRHPRVSEAIYPVDYGFLLNTTGGDGEGIDVFRGSAKDGGVIGAFLTADVGKRDVEVKVLLDCTESEIQEIQRMLYEVLNIGGLLVRRYR